jgi:hypothetical protein
MTKQTIIMIAMSAIATMAWTSSASAAEQKHPIAVPAAHASVQADQLPGVNPMTNAAPIRAVDHPMQAQATRGTNPMINAPPTPAVQHPLAFTHVPGDNPM